MLVNAHESAGEACGEHPTDLGFLPPKALEKRQKCLSVLDNLAWHSRTRARLLEPSIGVVDLLMQLSFSFVAVLPFFKLLDAYD